MIKYKSSMCLHNTYIKVRC